VSNIISSVGSKDMVWGQKGKRGGKFRLRIFSGNIYMKLGKGHIGKIVKELGGDKRQLKG